MQVAFLLAVSLTYVCRVNHGSLCACCAEFSNVEGQCCLSKGSEESYTGSQPGNNAGSYGVLARLSCVPCNQVKNFNTICPCSAAVTKLSQTSLERTSSPQAVLLNSMLITLSCRKKKQRRASVHRKRREVKVSLCLLISHAYD
jgi:hypothetical protein